MTNIMRYLALSVVLLLAASASTGIKAQSSPDEVAQNIEIVRRWLAISTSSDLAGAEDLLAAQHTQHIVDGTSVLPPAQRLEEIRKRRGVGGRVTLHQVDLFGQRDKVCVLYSAQTSTGPRSGVEVYRVTASKIAETWVDSQARGTLWKWDPAPNGDSSPPANEQVFRRWYEDIYPKADWQSVPGVAGPIFVRHETEEFEMSADEYGQRLRTLFARTGPLRFEYEVIAGADKIAVIGRGASGRGFLQAWRVRDGKLVDSWWAPGGAAW